LLDVGGQNGRQRLGVHLGAAEQHTLGEESLLIANSSPKSVSADTTIRRCCRARRMTARSGTPH
jgi:hypothetical protein